MLFAAVLDVPAQTLPSSLSLRFQPTAEIPLAGSSSVYTFGGAALFTAAYQPPLGLPVYVSGDLAYSAVDLELSGANLLHSLSLGVGAGVDFRFLRRLAFNAWAKGGIYYALTKTETGDPVGGMNPYIWLGGDFSYYITPALSFYVGGAYKNYMGKPQSLLSSANASLGVSYRINLSGGEDMLELPTRPPLLEIIDLQAEAIFPVFYRYYDDHPIGSLHLKNNERGTISNLQASVFIKRYMDSPKIVAIPGEIRKGETKEIELFALFTDSVLDIKEGDTVAAEITLEYDFKGQRKRFAAVETVALHHRNASIWDDNKRAAAFVTANDPSVLRLSKAVAGMVREHENQALDQNLRIAMALHQALQLFGLSYVVDPNSAYEEFIKDKHAVDFLQFPRQTLEYKAGDCDDLSILYCALLESVSVDTAFITAPGHIYIAFALHMFPETAKKTFADPQKLIYFQDKAWLPLEVTETEGGFLKAWDRGAREWQEHSPAENAQIYPLAEAWQMFKPVGLPGEGESLPLPAKSQMSLAYEGELNRFISAEIADRVKDLQDQISQNKNDPRLYNRLGVLYARFGQLSLAEQQFQRAVRIEEYAPALVNLGNIYYLRESYGWALDYYKRADEVKSGNPTTLLGIAKASYELEQYEEAKKNYSLVLEMSPKLAKDHDYLGQTEGGGARASDAAKEGVMLWED